jgi:glycosyltransferase involved in cell wall biosynthesis
VNPVRVVVGIAAGADGSGYHRMFQPFNHLNKNSRHAILIAPPGRQVPPPTREDVEEIDVLVMQRPVGTMGMRGFDAIDGAVTRVYEIDDDLLHADPSGLPHLCDKRLRDSVVYCMERAEMVTVSTPYLAEEFSRYNPDIHVLPNYINETVLNIPRRKRDRLTIGWAGGGSHMMDLCAVQEPLRAVLDAHPDVDMHFVGTDYSPLFHRECLWSGWNGDVFDYYPRLDFDIGICPLADVRFNYSKSHLKALDYGAMGIPVIATDQPAYRDYVQDGVTGYLVKSHEEWEKRLTELIHDPDARAEMGAAGKRQAAENTIQGHWQEWERVYELAAEGRS